MPYNNFSNGYKKVLLQTEENIRNLWLKYLSVEDIFLSIVKDSKWTIKEIFSLYWINEKLTLEIINKAIFNESLEKRKWVYSWMSTRLKNVILWSLKIAASFSKSKASIEDFLISMIVNDSWINSFFDYIGITSSDIEKNLRELNNIWSIDWEKEELPNTIDLDLETTESINKLLWALTQNIFKNKDWITPFDNNIEQENNLKESTTPALDFFSTNLTEEAKEWKIDKIIWRENEVERLVAILNRKTKNNPVLVWEPWVGKTAIVEWLALKIAEWKVPFSMKDKKVLALDMTSLVAWTKYRWEFESRIKQVVEEASKVENEIILFIDEIHTIIWAGWGEWTLDASNILKPAMWRWKIRIIWATTYNEYKKYIEKDSALERRFQQIVVNEPTKEIAKVILWWIKNSFEDYHNLTITDDAINEAVDLSVRYITDRFLPDKAIDLIDEACSLKSMKYNFDETEIKLLKEKISENNKKIEDYVISQQYKKAFKLKEKQIELENKITNLKQKFQVPKNKRFNVTALDVQKVLSISSGIPVSNLWKDETAKILGLERKIKSEIIWQDEAVSSIIKSIMRSKTGISNPNRPIWSFLFLWPTWVWKTELVKVLAKYFYDDKDALIKIDMSEYSDKTSVNKLIWASSGYVWYEDGWVFTEKVRKKPYSVVLFDEIEKWDFEVYNLLLQILEEWVLTDNKGKKINFKNTIIIMTSNIWQEEFTKKAAKIGFNVTSNEEEEIIDDYKRSADKIKQNLTDYFSPEFINRIDKIIVFNPLDKAQIKKIINIWIKDLENRLKEKWFMIKYNAALINFILKNVYNPDFWAREVRRFLVDNIEELIAEKIIQNKNKRDFVLSVVKEKITVK